MEGKKDVVERGRLNNSDEACGRCVVVWDLAVSDEAFVTVWKFKVVERRPRSVHCASDCGKLDTVRREVDGG